MAAPSTVSGARYHGAVERYRMIHCQWSACGEPFPAVASQFMHSATAVAEAKPLLRRPLELRHHVML